jgi:hypothetical protein
MTSNETARLLSYLEEHSNAAHVLPTGEIRVESHFILNGRYGVEWITIPATLSAVRDFLGY